MNKQFIQEMIDKKQKMLKEIELDIEYLETYKKVELEANEEVARQQLSEETMKPEAERDQQKIIDLTQIINFAKFTKQDYNIKKKLINDLADYISMLSGKLI